MSVRVTHTLDDLEADLRHIARTSRSDMRDVVRDGIRAGNELAKANARRKNGPRSHAWKYPGTFSAAMHSGGGLFGNVISGEYGPRPARAGLLAPILENGSRSGNAPQMNLARSADVIFPQFPVEVRAMSAKWFWPGMSEKEHLAAVKAALTAVGAVPLTLSDIKGLGTALPAYYTEVHVTERLGTGPRRSGAPSQSSQWRILTRAVAQTYSNAQNARRLAAEALHEAKLTVDGETYFVERALSDDPIVPDEGWYSGTSEFAY